MGKMKEIHLQGLEAIEIEMDRITAAHGRLLIYDDYIDYLIDVFEIEFVQKFRLAIFERVEYLEWNAERIEANAADVKEGEFLQAFKNSGLFFLDEIKL